MSLKKICFLLEIKPESLLKKTEFRELIRRGAITPKMSIGNPYQKYHVDYHKIRKLVIESDLISDISNATDGKIGVIIG